MDPVIEENEIEERSDVRKESSLTITTCEEVSSDNEESADNDLELDSKINNELSNSAQFVRTQTSVGTFGEVKIENSQDVHFGNKIFAAPITVVNAIGEEEQDKLGILEEKNIWERFKFSLRKTSKRERMAMGILTILVLIIVIITIVICGQLTTAGDTQLEGLDTSTESVTSEPYNCLVPRLAWTSVAPDEEINSVKPGAPLAIILHTATSFCKTHQDCAHAARSTQNYHMNVQGLGDIGYNFLVGGDGFIYEGRGWGKEGAHTRGFNKNSVGIAFTGKYHDAFPSYDTPTADQLQCVRQLLEEGVASGWLAANYSLVGYCDLLVGVPPGNVLLKEIRNWPHYRKDGNPGTCTRM